jgi:hypothetical protein
MFQTIRVFLSALPGLGHGLLMPCASHEPGKPLAFGCSSAGLITLNLTKELIDLMNISPSLTGRHILRMRMKQQQNTVKHKTQVTAVALVACTEQDKVLCRPSGHANEKEHSL